MSPLEAATAPVTAAVAGGIRQQAVPSNLDPALSRATASKARPFVDGCHQGWTGTSTGGCVYGDEASPTTVVLFGDSQATHWFPAVEAVADAGVAAPSP